MTYSNGQFNPNPLANPFNTRLGPSNYSLNPNSVSYNKPITLDSNAKLPDAKPIDQSLNTNTNDLQVPNQLDAPPIGVPILDNLSLDENFIQLPNGSIIDFKTGKIIKQNENMPKFVSMGQEELHGEWNDNHGIPKFTCSSDNNIIDVKSQEYWNQANTNSEKMLKELDDEQKDMLNTLNEFGFK